MSAAPPNPNRITSAPVLLPVEVVELEVEPLLEDELLADWSAAGVAEVPPVAGVSPVPLPVAANAMPGAKVIASNVDAIMAMTSRSANLLT